MQAPVVEEEHVTGLEQGCHAGRVVAAAVRRRRELGWPLRGTKAVRGSEDGHEAVGPVAVRRLRQGAGLRDDAAGSHLGAYGPQRADHRPCDAVHRVVERAERGLVRCRQAHVAGLPVDAPRQRHVVAARTFPMHELEVSERLGTARQPRRRLQPRPLNRSTPRRPTRASRSLRRADAALRQLSSMRSEICSPPARTTQKPSSRSDRAASSAQPSDSNRTVADRMSAVAVARSMKTARSARGGASSAAAVHSRAAAPAAKCRIARTICPVMLGTGQSHMH